VKDLDNRAFRGVPLYKTKPTMKKLLNTLSIVVCLMGSSLTGQTAKTTSGSSSEALQSDPLDSKANFINNQNYLSKSSLKDYKNYYGDSLKGFKEEEVKAELLSNHYYGQEFISVMNYRKRDFIDAKYKLGAYGAKPAPIAVPSSLGISSSKPIGGSNSINVAPCVNEDFEATAAGAYPNIGNAAIGWTVESTSSLGKTLGCGTPTAPGWVAGSPEFWIRNTPILGVPWIGNLGNSPLGGTRVAQLNDATPGFTVTRMSTTFPVTTANTLFQFAYAGSWNGSGHFCCAQPFFTINMFDCAGAPLGCSSISLTPPGANCQNGATGYSTTAGISWTNWQVKYIDLTPYVGTCVTMRIVNGDCNGGAHHGSLYFDAKCGGSVICGNCSPSQGTVAVIAGPVSFCAGSGVAQITAPTGYATYSWVAPPNAPVIPPSQATLATLNIQNPIPATVYTVNLMTPSGCLFVSTNTIVFTSVNIAGIASAPSCPGGASGTATVVGNGSGTGYNYSWINSTNSAIDTAAVITGLAPGIYSIVISGLGSAGCGSAVATVTIGTGPLGVQSIYKPFCGNLAYLSTIGGSNFQWYNGTIPIAAGLGGNSPSLTISPPTSGQIITLTYLSIYGCQDSVQFTMASIPPGFLSVTNKSWVCPGGNNGTALINLAPAAGSPPAQNSYQIQSMGTTPPYNTVSSPSSSSSFTFPLTGLSAGTYSVKSYDGSCYYSTTFSISPFVFDYTVSPVSPTLCPGNNMQASLTFTNPPYLGQYTYAWSPTTWLIGTTSNVSIINPTLAVGTQSTIVYTIVVTPSTINCPVTKSMTITAVNPPTPTITTIPALCNTGAFFQIQTTPSGGTFSTGFANSPISATAGFITPSNTNIAMGTNTFVYSININTCTASKTGTYQVSQFNTSALTSSVPPLCVTNPAFNLMNIVQNTAGGTWSGTGVTGNVFTPANLNTGNYQITYTRPSTPNPTVCASSTTLFVAVTKTITPVITSVPEFCSNASQFNMVVTPTGGGWLPNTGLSSTGLVTPANTTGTVLLATYTVNVGPCLNTNSTLLSISRFVPAALTGTVNNLCYNSTAFNLMSIVQNTTGSWSGSGVLNNLFYPTGLTTTVVAISYTTPSFPNAALCPDISTVAVSVLNPPTPQITQVGPYCNNGSPLQLTVNQNSGHWVTSSYVSSTGLFSPGLTSVGNNPIQYITGNSNCFRQDNKVVSIEAFVPATILSSIPDLCNTGAVVNLSPFTLSNQGTWSGSGITGTSFNPATTGSGNFTLVYQTASSPSGLCPDVASIAVNVFSLAAPSVKQAGPFCNKSLPVQLQVSPAGGLFGGASVGMVSNEGKFNPAAGIIGDNVVNYSITAGPCVAYAQTIIKVEKFVPAGFQKQAGPYCKNDAAINLSSLVENPGGKWLGGKGLLGDMFTPAFAELDATNSFTYMTHSLPTETLCPDSKVMQIEVRNNPVALAVTSTHTGCAPTEITFNIPDKTTGEGVWTYNDGSQPLKGTYVSHIFTKPGTYNVQLNYRDDIGCEAAPVKTGEIVIKEQPTADFSVPEEIYISEPQIQTTNLSTEFKANTYEWKVENVWKSAQASPALTFDKIGRYRVTLIATSYLGCKDEITKTIEVKNNYNIFIPNTFTPNFDGLNDLFIPVFTKEGIDTKFFEMEIFDRWGHSIFRTKDINKGWDGSVQNKGEPLKEDTYIYKIKYKDAEGNLTEKIGNVALVK